MDIEEHIAANISLNTEHLMALQPYDAVEKELHKADSVENIELNLLAVGREIYYAYLKNELADTAWTKQIAYELDQRIVVRLFNANIGYLKIIECIAHAPSYRQLSLEQRWIMATSKVTQTISPILALPEIAEAKPLRHWSILNFNTANHREIYCSYLKTILYARPKERMVVADRRIVHSMRLMGIADTDIFSYIAHSPQFYRYNDTYNVDEKIQAIHEFIEQN